jgi:hypothetical protein
MADWPKIGIACEKWCFNDKINNYSKIRQNAVMVDMGKNLVVDGDMGIASIENDA